MENLQKLSPSPEWLQRGIVSLGNPEALSLFHKKLRAHQPIVYGAIGGSITAGSSATPGNGYAARFAAWLSERSECHFINAGIGASDSMFGAFRAQRDLLQHRPDIITIEFAVNDARNPDPAGSFEWLIRQCVLLPQHPLVILIFTMFENGRNLQDIHIPIGLHYGLPMLSYRDAVYPEIQSRTLNWLDISPDEVHPNDLGHDFIYKLLIGYMESSVSLRNLKTATAAFPTWHNQEAQKYDGGHLMDANAMETVQNRGWMKKSYRGNDMGWKAELPGSALVVRFIGSLVAIGCRQYAGDFGRIETSIDDGEPKIVEGFFDGLKEDPPTPHWLGGHTPLTLLDKNLPHGRHLLKIKLLESRHSRSHGHNFEFGYLLVGGNTSSQVTERTATQGSGEAFEK